MATTSAASASRRRGGGASQYPAAAAAATAADLAMLRDGTQPKRFEGGAVGMLLDWEASWWAETAAACWHSR
eukprot:119607-Chlamydomonas_euryale.AAC.3